MKYRATLLVTTDMERTKRFYGEVLGLCIVADFGANITMTGGISFQTLESWAGFIGMPEGKIRLEGRAAELYFEEDDFDGFTARLEKMENIRLVHPVVEHRWAYHRGGRKHGGGLPALPCRRYDRGTNGGAHGCASGDGTKGAARAAQHIIVKKRRIIF